MVLKIKIGNTGSSKRNRSSCFENLSFYFTEYCDNTSIHGLKFLGERGRSVVEKLWWLIFLTVSLYFCVVLIMQIYHKWEISPVIVTFATTQTPVWKIPFPSVSICPEIKSKRSSYNFTDEYLRRRDNTDTDEEGTNRFSHMLLVCSSVFEFHEDVDTVDITNETAVDFLIEVAPDFDDILVLCRWLGEDLSMSVSDIEKLFTPTLTSEGICYTFNLLDRDELFTNDTEHYKNFAWINQDSPQWTLENGYDRNAELDAFPRRTMLSGMKGGLDLILATQDEDIDPLCGDSVPGYKVILQHPAEIPRAHEQYFRVPLDQDVVAAIKPKMMTTSEELRHYDSEDRQCYFIGEKKLRFFKTYSQQNCLLECLTNFTHKYCECVSFHMPRDNSTPICGPAMFECMSDANVLFLSKEVTFKLKNTQKNKKRKKLEFTPRTDDENGADCNCFPSCTSLEFESETSQSDWNWQAVLPLMNLAGYQGFHYSRLRIFFKDMQFITSERNQLYGQTDFWANCGGLLGLFTGFSFISVVEILYFVTLRFICNVQKFGLKYWSGAKELIDTKDE